MLVVISKICYSIMVEYQGIMRHSVEKVIIMNVLLDFGVVVLFVLFIYSGVKRGLVYMAINISGTIGASILSSFIASLMALGVYNSVVKSNIINAVSESTKNITETDPSRAASDIIDKLSDFSLNVFSYSGIDSSAIAKELKLTGLSIPEIIEGMIRPAAVKTVSIVLTLIFFVFFMFIVSFLANKFTKTIDRTALGLTNRILGAVAGAAQALIIVMVMSMIISFVTMFKSPENFSSMQEEINKTWFYKPISSINILDAIISRFVMQ